MGIQLQFLFGKPDNIHGTGIALGTEAGADIFLFTKLQAGGLVVMERAKGFALFFYRYIFPFMRIGENIKTVREAKKLSQKQVALSIGMDPSQYSKIEKGKTDPSISTVEKISAALGVSLSELFQSDEIFKDINSVDKTIMEKIKLIEQLDDQEKASLFNIIDGLFAKKRLKDSLSSALGGV
jgi:transcriptional regulator with XRE-family HTH domain